MIKICPLTPNSKKHIIALYSFKTISLCSILYLMIPNLLAQEVKEIPSVQIGEIQWMTENLNVVTPNSYCYNDSLSNCEKYGRLYTYEEAVNACPEGWRLPTKEDFDHLEAYIDQEKYTVEDLLAPNVWKRYPNASNRTGLSILPTGLKHKKIYRTLGESANLWILSEAYPEELDHIHILDFQEKKKNKAGKKVAEHVLYAYDHEHEKKNPIRKKRLFSVRCVR